jgi:hypothetical protein
MSSAGLVSVSSNVSMTDQFDCNHFPRRWRVEILAARANAAKSLSK